MHRTPADPERLVKPAQLRSAKSHWGLVTGLFLLAPLVSEYLLGLMSLAQLPLLLLLGPFYGGAAILIREVSRRRGLGWPGIFGLALAYAVIEEGLVIQSLFNPNFMELRLLDYGYVPALGMGAWWTVYVLGIHSMWSIAVPIALMESLSPAVRHASWLRTRWIPVIAVLFLAACAVNFFFTHRDGFMATTAQLAACCAVIGGLIWFALSRSRSGAKSASFRSVPRPTVVGGVAFLIGSAFMLLLLAGVLLGGAIPGLPVSGLIRNDLPVVVTVTAQLSILATGIVIIWNWSRRPDWTRVHELAVAGGMLLAYAWYGIVQVLLSHDRGPVDLIGQIGLATAAIMLLRFSYRRTSGYMIERRDST
jgi:hypothetical protein